MKKLAALPIALCLLLSGCLVEIPMEGGGRHGDRDHMDRDRDGDGGSNRGDHHQDDSRRR